MNFSELDFEALEDIPPLRRHYDVPRISITEKGMVSMNGALKRGVGAQREFRAKTSPDGRYLLLCSEETPNICFSAKGGNVLHLDFKQYLEAKGISLPALYTDRLGVYSVPWRGSARPGVLYTEYLGSGWYAGYACLGWG